jgi:putative transposase
MPYPPRQTPAGVVFHVINRAIRKQQLFAQPSDYNAFVNCAVEAHRKVPVGVLAYCVMPNHFHFVLQSREDGQISRFMARMTATHSKRWHVHRGSVGTGAVYQGRFRAFPVQTDDYFYRVCRYVEANAVRAGLVRAAEEWPWCSLADRVAMIPRIPIDPWPLPRPSDWSTRVNGDPSRNEKAIRESISTGRPFGEPSWVERVARELSLEHTLHPHGRPQNDL